MKLFVQKIMSRGIKFVAIFIDYLVHCEITNVCGGCNCTNVNFITVQSKPHTIMKNCWDKPILHP